MRAGVENVFEKVGMAGGTAIAVTAMEVMLIAKVVEFKQNQAKEQEQRVQDWTVSNRNLMKDIKVAEAGEALAQQEIDALNGGGVGVPSPADLPKIEEAEKKRDAAKKRKKELLEQLKFNEELTQKGVSSVEEDASTMGTLKGFFRERSSTDAEMRNYDELKKLMQEQRDILARGKIRVQVENMPEGGPMPAPALSGDSAPVPAL